MALPYSNDFEGGTHLGTSADFTNIGGSNFLILDEVSFSPPNAPQGTKSYCCADAGDRNYYNGMTSTGDQQITTSSYLITGHCLGHILRSPTSSNDTHYFCYYEYSGGNLSGVIDVRANGLQSTTTRTYNIAASTGDTVYMESKAIGSTIELRVWVNSAGRPSTATQSISDSTYTTGVVGLRKIGASGTYVNVDELVITNGSSSGSSYTLTADQASYSLTGQTTGLLFNRTLVAANGSYALTGQDVTLQKATPGAYNMPAEAGSYSWNGSNALGDYAMNAINGSYALSGQDVTFSRAYPQNYTLTANGGSYTFNGNAARLVWSGAPIVPNRQAGIYMGMRIGL